MLVELTEKQHIFKQLKNNIMLSNEQMNLRLQERQERNFQIAQQSFLLNWIKNNQDNLNKSL